ncbi:arrestin domain-containing protein 3-like isoform X2 [Ruditapes philippinarum]|uniref:arrestin domain-containing protein 3-like isoform X2 n=1 Tax=Ruditapes philippinarum TaxID=129788 RepID=UPI00295A905C|nr:arrestin domain-containing protein 3-like isoform X2 [Ruditapes philippinarum]
MPKLRKLEITLNSPQVVYYPGQVIQGQVIIELAEDMKMRGIHILCKGKGHIEWEDGDSTTKDSETYVNVMLTLYNGNAGEDITLHAGNHLFPFQFVLPINIPGSFEGKSSCYVRYWLKANIDRPWKFDPEYKMLFTVGSVLDLNTQANAMSPQQSNDSKTVCCCCCESQPITATFRIDRTGYVPGESICCNAEINEGTGRGVHSSKVKLMMKTTYRTHGGSKTKQTTEVARLEHGSITPGGSDIWSGERIQVPPVPPSFLPYCNIIEIDYYVVLAVDVSDTPFDLTLELPVVIGSIPLQSVVSQYMPQMQPGTITNQPMGFSAPVNFDLPPPAYHECVFGKVDTTDDDDKNAGGNMNYAPSYTYYDWMSQPPAPAQY